MTAEVHRPAIVVIILLFAACTTEAPDGDGQRADAITVDTLIAADAPPASTDATPRLTANGWGPLRIGMSRAEITAVAGEDANPGLVGGPEPEACDQYRPTGAPEGMLLMLENDTLTRITLMRESRVRTERGFGLGDSASVVLAAYGSAARSSPHKYRDAPSAYITVWTTPPQGTEPARGIVYEIDDQGLVGQVHAGAESITYVEGCL